MKKMYGLCVARKPEIGEIYSFGALYADSIKKLLMKLIESTRDFKKESIIYIVVGQQIENYVGSTIEIFCEEIIDMPEVVKMYNKLLVLK